MSILRDKLCDLCDSIVLLGRYCLTVALVGEDGQKLGLVNMDYMFHFKIAFHLGISCMNIYNEENYMFSF